LIVVFRIILIISGIRVATLVCATTFSYFDRDSHCTAYLNLGQENENNCDIFSYNYGQAGAVMFYGKKINIPQPVSFSGSFVFWAPDSLSEDFMIIIQKVSI